MTELKRLSEARIAGVCGKFSRPEYRKEQLHLLAEMAADAQLEADQKVVDELKRLFPIHNGGTRMAVKFTVEIIRENGEEDISDFIASSRDASGSDVIFMGHGKTPYEALCDLIAEFENAELYRPD